MASDGREVILRIPCWSDLDDMLEFINSLVDEGADVLVDKRKTRDEEIEWLADHLKAIELGRKVCVAAEVGGRLVGQVEVTPRPGRSRHVGVLGVSLRQGYRDVGVGTELMREAEAQARGLGVELLILELFASNARARHVYEKVGFSVTGVVPKAIKREGVYVDSVSMAKELWRRGGNKFLRGRGSCCYAGAFGA
jgi:RimJ/RimL family protein N-acetyltransferase